MVEVLSVIANAVLVVVVLLVIVVLLEVPVVSLGLFLYEGG